MKFYFEGTADEFNTVFPEADDPMLWVDEPEDFTPASEVAGKAESVATAADAPTRIGLAQRLALRRAYVRSRVAHGANRLAAAVEFAGLDEADLLYAIQKTCETKGLAFPSAIGDGKLLEQFLAFISEHWEDILKIILSLLGLAI